MRDDARRPEVAPQRELTFGQQPERAATRGALVWLVAAAALVTGLVLGFTSGYAAGQRNAAQSAPQPAPESIAESSPPADVTPSDPASSQAFSDATVPDPPRVDPEPIVVPEERSDRSSRSDRSDRSNVPNRPSAPNVPKAPNVSNVSSEPNAPSGPGSIEVLSRPAGAQVIVDGRIVGKTPLSLPNVAAGTHDVRLELAGFNRWATSVQVSPGARARVAASLEQP